MSAKSGGELHDANKEEQDLRTVENYSRYGRADLIGQHERNTATEEVAIDHQTGKKKKDKAADQLWEVLEQVEKQLQNLLDQLNQRLADIDEQLQANMDRQELIGEQLERIQEVFDGLEENNAFDVEKAKDIARRMGRKPPESENAQDWVLLLQEVRQEASQEYERLDITNDSLHQERQQLNDFKDKANELLSQPDSPDRKQQIHDLVNGTEADTVYEILGSKIHDNEVSKDLDEKRASLASNATAADYSTLSLNF